MKKLRRFSIGLFLLIRAKGILPALAGWLIVTPAAAEAIYETLNFGTSGTFLTGIRGDNIVGNYVIPETSATGGLLYNTVTATWMPFPVATPSGANFPGAISSSPYGPSFGSAAGILRAVGSYKTGASSPYDLRWGGSTASAADDALVSR
jgi:subtilase-type serine protease